MSFFNKLEGKGKGNTSINNDFIEYDLDNNYKVNNIENNDFQLGGNITKKLELNNYDNINNVSDSSILQDNINKFKKYIEFIDNDQHYFINYNNCYELANKIININNSNNIQEIKNNIKLSLSKYKQIKNYKLKLDKDNILVYDIKKNDIIDKINFHICLDLQSIHDNEYKKLNNIYSKTKLSYNLLLTSDNVLESKINEFKKLRTKCEKSINNYYIIQYLLNKTIKNNVDNSHYITHSIEQVYNANKDNVQTLLILRNKNINQDTINKIIEEESILLNEYIDIKKRLVNKSDTQDNTEIKASIKKYLIMKNNLSNKLDKINNIKNKNVSSTLYLTKEDIQTINFKPFTSYYNSIIGNINNINEKYINNNSSTIDY